MRDFPVEYVSLAAADVIDYRPQILNIYHDAFAGPPYNRGSTHKDGFGAALLYQIHRAGFCCEVARDPLRGELVGFAYGYTGAAGQWWRDAVVRGLNKSLVARWLADYFELVELAVHPQAQGYGVGGHLHDRLLQGQPHRTAALSTHQTETAASQLYRKRGWVPILENFIFPGSSDPYVIMGLDLALFRTMQTTKPPPGQSW